MKLSDGFDARRLRPKGQRNWRFRIGATIAALLAMSGVLLAMAGVASLLGHAPTLGEINTNRAGAAVILVIGLVVLYLGVWLWRRCRRRSRQAQGLNMSPHLMKKHD
jgi:membrane protein implicated in regulation of membrane protease activity